MGNCCVRADPAAEDTADDGRRRDAYAADNSSGSSHGDGDPHGDEAAWLEEQSVSSADGIRGADHTNAKHVKKKLAPVVPTGGSSPGALEASNGTTQAAVTETASTTRRRQSRGSGRSNQRDPQQRLLHSREHGGQWELSYNRLSAGGQAPIYLARKRSSQVESREGERGSPVPYDHVVKVKVPPRAPQLSGSFNQKQLAAAVRPGNEVSASCALQREAALLSAVPPHSNIIPLADFFEIDDVPYVVTPRILGHCAQDFLTDLRCDRERDASDSSALPPVSEGGLDASCISHEGSTLPQPLVPDPIVKALVLQALSAAAHLAAHGAVHRDIKGANIMLATGNEDCTHSTPATSSLPGSPVLPTNTQLVLIDFGCACAAPLKPSSDTEPQPPQPIAADAVLSAGSVGAVVGSTYWMAPEAVPRSYARRVVAAATKGAKQSGGTPHEAAPPGSTNSAASPMKGRASAAGQPTGPSNGFTSAALDVWGVGALTVELLTGLPLGHMYTTAEHTHFLREVASAGDVVARAERNLAPAGVFYRSARPTVDSPQRAKTHHRRTRSGGMPEPFAPASSCATVAAFAEAQRAATTEGLEKRRLHFSTELRAFLKLCFTVDPCKRATAEELLRDPAADSPSTSSPELETSRSNQSPNNSTARLWAEWLHGTAPSIVSAQAAAGLAKSARK